MNQQAIEAIEAIEVIEVIEPARAASAASGCLAAALTCALISMPAATMAAVLASSPIARPSARTKRTAGPLAGARFPPLDPQDPAGCMRFFRQAWASAGGSQFP